MTDSDTALARVANISRRMGAELRRQWVRRVLASGDLTAAQKTVLVALETYADYGDGTNAHPGENNLAEMCGITTRAVRAALARARDLGLVERTAVENPRAGRAAVYRLVFSDSDTGTAVPVNEPTTGTAVPADNSTTGMAVPVNNPITGTATSPSPEQPFLPPSQSPNLLGELRNWGTSPAPVEIAHTPTAPSQFCADHPHGTAKACHACRVAGDAFKAWRTADERRRHALRVNCPWCHGTGNRDIGDDLAQKCDHLTPPPGLGNLSLVPPLPDTDTKVRAAR